MSFLEVVLQGKPTHTHTHTHTHIHARKHCSNSTYVL